VLRAGGQCRVPCSRASVSSSGFSTVRVSGLLACFLCLLRSRTRTSCPYSLLTVVFSIRILTITSCYFRQDVFAAKYLLFLKSYHNPPFNSLTSFLGPSGFANCRYAAYNVWASLSNQKQLGFRYTPLGEMMSLGAGDASVGFLLPSCNDPLAVVVIVARTSSTNCYDCLSQLHIKF